jgi:hypothetical protein
VAVLLTNENDLSIHFGIGFLPGQNNPVHKGWFDRQMASFAQATGLPADRLWRTWEPGPSKYFLNDLEHRFNRTMIDDLRSDGLRVPIATSNFWSPHALGMLPSLADGDIIDAHSYGESEELRANARYLPNFITSIAAGQVYGKPLAITEWNVTYPALDRFTAPLYVASIASLQGWDAPMIYNYSQTGLARPGVDPWTNGFSTFCDPALSGVMPAAAIAFRRGHISPARATYCLKLSPAQLLDSYLEPGRTATIRTLAERSRITIGFPAIKELPWVKPTDPGQDVIVVTDPNHDYIPPGQSFVRSDTGELARNWKAGIQTIDTPRTQAVSGWIGGKTLELKDATFQFSTKKAVVALTSIDDEPLSSSRFVLITTVGQARAITASDQVNKDPRNPLGDCPFMSEPVAGTIQLRTKTSELELLSLGPRGKIVSRMNPTYERDALNIGLPFGRGTHWYVLRPKPGQPAVDPAEPPSGP